ncbi:DUF4430 domain-containing protein [Brevibacillus fortis]|uniref:SLH domain-containing protein n=1 Tax=Brevibacillus fortis TaxID=2126352 RepID=A0A2P7VK35_9BACL|nr:DUF4430 domain-containing protein [Brevibacillus fortis]PSJ99587.1 hypothetical protein C7R93_02610 [Brevibacillus fortis]
MSLRRLAARLLILTVFCLSFLQGNVSAASKDATISAKQNDRMVVISGETSTEDPAYVPLLVIDARGQAIYFQDVVGKGAPFTVSFEIPDEVAKGMAVATLFSKTKTSHSFPIRSISQEHEKIKVTFSITGYKGEEIFEKRKLSVEEGISVFQLLQYASELEDFPIEYEDGNQDGHDVYIVSIDGLAEFDKGPKSGWVYKVNGEGPQVAVDRYYLEDDAKVEFLYTADLGKTELGENADSSTIIYQISSSTLFDNAMHQLQYTSTGEQIVDVVMNVLYDLTVLNEEEQQKHMPDVATLFQAAHERAATMIAKDADAVSSVTINERQVKELLEEQAIFRIKLGEHLVNMPRFQPFLTELKPTLVVALPNEESLQSAELFFDEYAWKHLLLSKVPVIAAKGNWRTTITPVQPSNSHSLSYKFRFHDGAEQSKQLENLQTRDGKDPFPLTSGYRITTTQPAAGLIAIDWPMSNTIEAGMWPTLYQRPNEQGQWLLTTTYLQVAKNRVTGKIGTHTGDVAVLAIEPSYQDLWELPAHQSWIKEPILALSAIGVMEGQGEGTFGLNDPVTREELLETLQQLRGGDNVDNPAMTQKIQTPLKRVDVAQLLVKESGVSQEVSKPMNVFVDEKEIAPEAKAATQIVLAKGWMTGRSDGRFDPYALVTRQEIAVILYRYWKETAGVKKE